MHSKLHLSFIFAVLHVGTINSYLYVCVKVCLDVSDRENDVCNLFTCFNCYKISLWEKKAERSLAKYCVNCEMFSS